MTDGGMIAQASPGPPDHVGAYTEAFQHGRALAGRPPRRGGPDPIALGVHIARMDEGARQAVARRTEAVRQVLLGLRGATSDPAERLRMARHLAGVTPGLGVRPGDISFPDITDAGIAGHIARVARV